MDKLTKPTGCGCAVMGWGIVILGGYFIWSVFFAAPKKTEAEWIVADAQQWAKWSAEADHDPAIKDALDQLTFFSDKFREREIDSNPQRLVRGLTREHILIVAEEMRKLRDQGEVDAYIRQKIPMMMVMFGTISDVKGWSKERDQQEKEKLRQLKLKEP